MEKNEVEVYLDKLNDDSTRVPVASTSAAGIAQFSSEDFVVDANGLVHILNALRKYALIDKSVKSGNPSVSTTYTDSYVASNFNRTPLLGDFFWKLFQGSDEKGSKAWIAICKITHLDSQVKYTVEAVLDTTGPEGIQGPKGDKGEKGEKGDTPSLSAKATIDNTTGTPTVTVSRGGTDLNPVFTFAFHAVKGDKGEKGNTGDAAGFASPTATAETLAPGAKATASVTASGDSKTKKFDFKFGIPQGAKGDKGDRGEKGEKGDDGDPLYTFDLREGDLILVKAAFASDKVQYKIDENGDLILTLK